MVMKILEFLDEGILLLNIGIVVISIIRLLFGHTKCCTAKIDYVFVSYRRNSSGTQKRYRITFAHGADGIKETKTVDYDQYVRNFNPVRYEGEYISVITADMEYFVLRKKYKVKRRRWT